MPLSCSSQLTHNVLDLLKDCSEHLLCSPSDNHTLVFEPQTVQEAVNRALWGDCRYTNDTYLPHVDISTASPTSKADWLNKQPPSPSPGKNVTLCVKRFGCVLEGMGPQKELINVFIGRWAPRYTASFSCVFGPVAVIWRPFSESLFWLQRHHVTFPLNTALIFSLPKHFILFPIED